MKPTILLQLALIAVIITPLCRAQASIAGDWQGTLSAGGQQFRLALHITAAKDGTLAATLDSLDQGANGIPVTAITLQGAKLSLTIDAVHGGYEGTVTAAPPQSTAPGPRASRSRSASRAPPRNQRPSPRPNPPRPPLSTAPGSAASTPAPSSSASSSKSSRPPTA